MADNKKPNTNKKPKLNAYWIYAIVIAIFLFINVFSGGMGGSEGNPTSPAQFFSYLENGDVAKIEIVNKREAKVYLTRDAVKKRFIKNPINHHFLLFQENLQTTDLNLVIFKISKMS